MVAPDDFPEKCRQALQETANLCAARKLVISAPKSGIALKGGY
jgi:hypothetical protein